MHNHELDKGLEGHLVAGRLKPHEKEFLDEMTRNAVAPKNILSTLKERDPNNKTSAKQVYNARHRYKAKLRASMTEMQHLCKKLDENNYFFKYRTDVEDGAEHLQDIFFADPKDLALMNAIPAVFPDTAALVCRFHIEKNLSTKARELVKVRDGEKIKASEVRDNVCLAFRNVLESSTEDEYAGNVLEFRKLCERWPKFLRYIEETILDTDKERVANAWVDKYMHMGNHTTNRAKSSHGVLKGYLTDGLGDLLKD
ncbi:hypothetical protein L195_g037995 [Trifolium pratense]|uniref:Uncharacterized protein n=1 Tax=Trifolium pratense TaxID=57577 RepID=A0A2K3LTW2_TRIPR|nr:hypothetical protein L195_g037995 [Trifolium pratense]